MKLLCANKKVHFEYIVLEQYEAGIVLSGCEVKSCISKNISLSDSYCVFSKGILWLHNASISLYEHSRNEGYNPKKDRALLLHKAQLRKLCKCINIKGFSIVPLDIHVSENGKIKVTIAVCKGKNAADKRQSMKDRDCKMELKRLVRM